jgi:hypothetical protein
LCAKLLKLGETSFITIINSVTSEKKGQRAQYTVFFNAQ